LNSEELFERVKKTCLNDPTSPLEGISFEIAKFELANTMYFKFGEEQARQTLGEEYSEELMQVKDFYK